MFCPIFSGGAISNSLALFTDVLSYIFRWCNIKQSSVVYRCFVLYFQGGAVSNSLVLLTDVLSYIFRWCNIPQSSDVYRCFVLNFLMLQSPTVLSCLLTFCCIFSGGALSNSLALFTDVLHLGSDLISFLISLLAIYLARKPATKKMSFGYHRAGQ